jgi:ATPase subunit of ABC transporter with duplicated ATPase domains
LARALNEAGVGVVIISHDDEIIKTLAVKIIALDGRGNFWTMPRDEYLEKDTHHSGAVAN